MDKRYTILTLIIISSVNLIYFYNVFTKSNFTIGFWEISLPVIFIIACLNHFGTDDNEKKIKEFENTNTYSQFPQTSFDDFIAGRMSLAKCFWLYFMLIGFVLSFLCVYFAELYQQLWLYIFPIAYYAPVTVAVWNCATLYTKDKLENKQPYGWAIATKIYISFNAVVIAGQIFTILNTK
jgi:hypothetical protein